MVVGLFFLIYLWTYFRRRGGADWMASVFFGGAIVFAVSGGVAAGVGAALIDNPKALSPDTFQVLNTLNQDLNFPLTCIGLALMYFAAGVIIRRTKVLPGWLAWASWVLAVAALTFFLGFIALIGTAIWVIVVGIMMARRNPAMDAAAPAPTG